MVTKSLVSLTQLLNSAGNFSVLQELREVLEGKGVDWKTRDIRLEVPHVWLAVAAFV